MSLITPASGETLSLVSYLDRVEGPVVIILERAGRSGVAPMRALSELERSLAAATAIVICLLVLAATFVRNRYAALLALPALSFPWIVFADIRRWLQPVVTGLSEAAGEADSRVLIIGRTNLGTTVVEMGPGGGLFLAVASSVAILAGLWLHRRAYRTRPGELEPGADHR
jgi:hypothetical protein